MISSLFVRLAATLAFSAALASLAHADFFDYRFTLTPTRLGSGGVFGIAALPARPASGHVSFDVDPAADDIGLIGVVDFGLTIGDRHFAIDDLAIGLFDFRPATIGGPLISAVMEGTTIDRAFFSIDTGVGWIAGSDVFTPDCDFAIDPLGPGCIAGGPGSVTFASSVPEPGTSALFALALGGLLWRRRVRSS